MAAYRDLSSQLKDMLLTGKISLTQAGEVFRAHNEEENKKVAAYGKAGAPSAQAIAAMQQAAGIGNASTHKMYPDTDKLAMRMNWHGAGDNNFEACTICRVESKVMVWIVQKSGEYVVLEDDPLLFPSDNLVTQIRILQG